MMQKNVGTWDALMKSTFGLTGLAWSASRLVQRPVRLMPLMVAGLSAMKLWRRDHCFFVPCCSPWESPHGIPGHGT